jgi:hypothetical protein
MSKVVQIKQPIDTARAQAATENWCSTIVRESDDLCAEIRDVRTVVATATEAWVESEQRASTCVGVLDVIDYKLELIESAAHKIFESARIPKPPKIQKGGRS